jgi:hypothetical protein
MSNEYPPPGSGQGPADSDQPPPPPPGSGGQPGYGDQPYGQPPSYPPSQPGGAPGGYGMPQKTSPLAIVSLVLGILGIPCCTFFVFGIGAVVTGYLARKQINESHGALKGGGMATAGLILGIVTIVLAIVVWILNLSGVIESNYNFETN